MAEDQKSWWQTAAGLMTGVAALITALTGLILAVHQIRKDSEEGKRPVAGQATSTHDSLPAGSPKPSPGGAIPSGTTLNAPSKTEARTDWKVSQQRVASVLNSDRPAYSLPLPAKHEFAMGDGSQSARFILTAIRLEPHTAESDILKVSVQVLADGQLSFPFYNTQFELRIDEQPYRSTTSFTENIPSGQSRDHDLHFTIPHAPVHAVLWIHQWLSNAEIPLDITAPK